MIFNYRLSRCRRCVECAFGIMCSKWRLLYKPIETKIEKAENIAKAITLLHNIIIDLDGIPNAIAIEEAMESFEFQKKNQEITNISRKSLNRYSNDAKQFKDTLKSYFNSPIGKISFQDICYYGKKSD